jgi:diguanylate cyclase (GGDEF)-like protein/PAS domain S-box-containing protein
MSQPDPRAPRPGADPTTRDADRRFHALVERGSDLAMVCDDQLVIRYVGPSLGPLFGYSADEVLGVGGDEFAHPDDRGTLRRAWESLLPSPGAHTLLEIRVRHRDGSWRWVEGRITNLSADPAVAGMLLNVRDVTERRSATAALAANEQLHRSILEAAQEGVWVTDRDGRTLFANAKMAELLGVDRETLSVGSVLEFFDQDAMATVRDRIARRATGIREQYELPFLRGDGEPRWLLVAGSPLYAPDGTHRGSVGMCVDITERKRMEQELQRLALYDSLTGLANRALLADRLERLAAELATGGSDFAVLFCDVDRFKSVNDTRGHAGGDEVLVAVAQRMLEAARDGDTVARLGGDEFVLLCPGADAYTARRLAQHVTEAFRTPLDVRGEQVLVSVSIGVAATPEVAPETLLRAADAAVYDAKERGGAQVCVHDPVSRASAEERAQLVADLRTAVEQGALTLVYQPVVRLGGGSVGVEALLRWDHPTRGPVPPSQFIPIAECEGLMGPLGAWTLRQACTDAVRQLSAADDDWQLAVNLSAAQLADDAVVDHVAAALQASGLEPGRLVLEVTETAVFADLDRAAATMDALKSLGVGLALDDFGTGYSSLANLRQFPIDTIKIDRSFVSGLGRNEDDTAIVASLVSLAAAVGMDAVAEGVETAAQEEALRRLGCPLAQGFRWSPGVPAAELPATIARLAHGRLAGPAPEPGWPPSTGVPEESVMNRIAALHRSGASLNTIAAALNAEGSTTPRGARWHRNSVARAIAARQFGATPLRDR